MNIDLIIFNLINGLSFRWQWLDYAGIFFAHYFEYFLWLALALFLVINFKKYWKMVAEALVAGIFIRLVLAEVIRFLWFRPRPFVSLNLIPLINQSPLEASFPSGHATFYFALSTIIYYYNKKAGILFYIASSLIVLARVFVGIHWPSDILGGAVLGILMGYILNKLFRKYSHVFPFYKN